LLRSVSDEAPRDVFASDLEFIRNPDTRIANSPRFQDRKRFGPNPHSRATSHLLGYETHIVEKARFVVERHADCQLTVALTGHVTEHRARHRRVGNLESLHEVHVGIHDSDSAFHDDVVIRGANSLNRTASPIPKISFK
jgi:hypothetical protein